MSTKTQTRADTKAKARTKTSNGTKPEQWSFVQKGAKGVRDAKMARDLWGEVVIKESAVTGGTGKNRREPVRDNRLYEVGLAALRAMQDQAAVRYGSRAAARDIAPILFGRFQVRQRALLVSLGKGLVPLAHIGRDGYTPLTESQARDSMVTRKGQNATPPPGKGFASTNKGARRTMMHALERIQATLQSPAVSVPVSMAGTAVTAAAAWRVFKNPIQEGASWLQEAMS